MLQFNHFNFNVLDLERSLAFYRQALELEVEEEKEPTTAPSSWCTWGTGRPASVWS